MLVECTNCGAPLDVGKSDRFVTCRYCDKSTRVKSLKTLAMQTPKDFNPPQVWKPPPQVRVQKQLQYHSNAQHKATTAANKATSTVGCIVGLASFSPLLIGGVVALTEIPMCQPSIEAGQTPELGAVNLAGPNQLTHTWNGLASGDVPVDSEMGSNCRGAVPEAPHVALVLAESRHVSLRTTSTEDTVMLLRTVHGQYLCDDDSGGERQPLIESMLSAGTHQVWVGTYSTNTVASFTLTLMSNPPGASPEMMAGLAPNAPPLLGSVDLEQTPAGGSLSGQASSGTVDANQLGSQCRGWLTNSPTLVLRVPTQRSVAIETVSGADLVLAVRTPSGPLICDDDSGNGNNARIGQGFVPGLYPVWVGTYQQNASHPFTVQITAQ